MSKAKEKIIEYQNQQQSNAQQELLESLKNDKQVKKNLGIYLNPAIDIAKEYVKAYPQIDNAYETLKNTKLKIGLKKTYANGIINKYGLNAKGEAKNQNSIKLSKYNTYSAVLSSKRRQENEIAKRNLVEINPILFTENCLNSPENAKEMLFSAKDDFYRLEVLCHEMCHNLAKVEYKLFDVIGEEIPLKALGTKAAMYAIVVKFAGGVSLGECCCDENGFPETQKEKGNCLTFRQNSYSAYKNSRIALLHEGMTEYISRKMVKNGALDKYAKNQEVLKDMKSRTHYKSYIPFAEYISMVDSLSPGCIEESYFGGIEKENILLQEMHLDYMLGQIYKIYEMDLEGFEDAKNLKNFTKNLKKAFCIESEEVQKLYHSGKIKSADVKRYYEARNKFWSFDNVYYGLMISYIDENIKIETEVKKFCQSMQTDTSCDVEEIFKSEHKMHEKMLGDMNTRKFFGRQK